VDAGNNQVYSSSLQNRQSLIYTTFKMQLVVRLKAFPESVQFTGVFLKNENSCHASRFPMVHFTWQKLFLLE
jgi:hypothetical protein